MNTTFSCDYRKAKYATTRRGVNVTVPLILASKVVGTLDDIAERIVAPVTFNDPAVRVSFLAEARQQGFDQESDDFAISEYARSILSTAEAGVLAASK